MIINQINIFGKESKAGEIQKPSKIAKEIARPFKCVLCGEMVKRLDGGVCTLCFNEKLAKDRKVR
jgi:ribosomal protein L34E